MVSAAKQVLKTRLMERKVSRELRPAQDAHFMIALAGAKR